MLKIGEISGGEVIHADDGVPLSQQQIAEVAAKKTGCSSNKNCLRRHSFLCSYQGFRFDK